MPSEETTTEIEAAVGELKLEEVGAITGEVEETSVEETPVEEVPVEDIQEVTDDTEGTPVEETPAGEAPAEETPPVISDELLERAVDVGISVADARELTPESINRIIASREAENKRVWEAQEKKAHVEQSKEESADPFADMPELDPEVYDAATIAMFEKLKGIAQQQQETIRGYGARQEETERAAEATNRRDTVQWFDKQVTNLGENFVDALGAGGYDTLDQGSSQFLKREELASQVHVLLAGYRATGQEAPPRDEVFDTAARLVLHDDYQRIEGEELSGKLKKRATQHIQRAGGQKATGKETPMEEAARMLDEKYSS